MQQPEKRQKTSGAAQKGRPSAAQKRPSAGQKGPSAAQKRPSAGQKSPTASQKRPSAAQKSPTASQKSSGANQETLGDNFFTVPQSVETEDKKPTIPELSKSGFGNYFRDGIRRLDYILVWEENLNSIPDSKSELRAAFRRRFEESLMEAGVELERETSVSTKKIINYVKLFVTWQTMCCYAEYLGFRAPFELFTAPSVRKMREMHSFISPLDQDVPNKPQEYYTCAFSSAKLGQYVGSSDQDTYFRTTQRFEVAFVILGTQVYGSKELCEVGLQRMINEGIYTCAFPPHDGPFEMPPDVVVPPDVVAPPNVVVPPEDMSDKRLNPRQVLHKYWARWSQWYKYQPLDHIRQYFGEKIAFYFAFLGYYTTWLAPASVVGILVFVYNSLQMDTSEIVKESCASGKAFKMCPLCEDRESGACKYWYLSEICMYIRLTFLFDNSTTVLYSLFVSFWACAFLEHWKRYAAALSYKWDVIDFLDLQETPRPEYSAKCTEYELDPVTGNMEPHFPLRRRVPRLMFGALSVVLMMSLSMSCLLIMLITRAVVLGHLFKNELLRTQALTVSNIVASLVNLVLVLVLEIVYEKVAVWITEWEMHRTQTQFENSLIIKVFIFELFNYYVSIGYTALIKGSITGKPGEYNTFFGMRLAHCFNGSCMFEVTQMLAVGMIVKQLALNVIEVLLPKLITWVHQRIQGLNVIDSNNRLDADYMLIQYDGGFIEYLEVIMQFGLITLFVPAFPLAPLFALLNNVVEIRLDARKLVCGTRRPLPERAQSIGVWFNMLNIIMHLSTLSNALLMAFTSEFLPTTVYAIMFDRDLKGYRNFTLSWAPPNTTSEPCRYNAMATLNSGYNEFFWKLFSARIIFVLGYQQLVTMVGKLISNLIPDLPEELALKIKRQNYISKQALLSAEQQGHR